MTDQMRLMESVLKAMRPHGPRDDEIRQLARWLEIQATSGRYWISPREGHA